MHLFDYRCFLRPPHWPPRPRPAQAGWRSSWLAQIRPDPAMPACWRRPNGYMNLRFNKLRGGFLNLRPSALTARAATCARVGLALSIQNGRDPSWPPWPQVVQVRRDGCHQRPGFSSRRTRFSRQGLLEHCALCKLLHQRSTALHLHVRSAHASSNTLFLHARIAICST